MKRLLVLLFLGLFISIIINGQSIENIDKYSKIKIMLHDKSQFKELQQAGLSLEGMKFEENSVERIVNTRVLVKLDELGLSYQILIDDMTKYYLERIKETEVETQVLRDKIKKEQSPGGFGLGSMGGFYTFDEIVAQLDTMRMLYPNLITEKDSVGHSVQDRPIWAVKISDNPEIEEDEPQIFYNSLVHAREPAGMMTNLYFMYYLLENYGIDPEVTYLVDNRELYFIPVINPDGYVYNQQISPNGGGLWRKNRRFTGGSLYGIDICRNYDYMWGLNNIGSTPVNSVSDETYRGTEPFSEPETQAVRDFCLNHKFTICVNFHSYWDIVYTPWGYNLNQTPDSLIFNKTIWLATQLNNYGNWINDPTIYERNGDHLDWMYGEQIAKPKIYAYLPEIGNQSDGFWPKPDRIFPLAEENLYPNLVYAWGPGIIENPPYIASASVNPNYLLNEDDSITIVAKEINPDGYNSTVTATITDELGDTVDHIALIKTADNLFAGKWVPTVNEERFYFIILKQSGIEKPSNFYFNDKQNLSFTTVPAPKVEIVNIEPNNLRDYRMKLKMTNSSNTSVVKNPWVKLTSADSSIETFRPEIVPFPNLEADTSALSKSYLYIDVSDDFDGYLDFKYEVLSDGKAYWGEDSLRDVAVNVVQLSAQMPNKYSLTQNYPNPFNPSTKISYTLPLSMKSEKVNIILKVYDILGREIATLVNQKQKPGNYEVEWNANIHSSGIYFYKLQAGEFAEIKKMMLLK